MKRFILFDAWSFALYCYSIAAYSSVSFEISFAFAQNKPAAVMRVGVGPGRMGLGLLGLGSSPYFLVNQKVNFEKVLNDHDQQHCIVKTNWQRWRVGVDPGRITSHL